MTESETPVTKSEDQVTKKGTQTKESLEKIPPWILATFSKKPKLILVKGLGRTQRVKYDVEGNTVFLKQSAWKRGQKRDSATFTVGSIITLGAWPTKRPFIFLRKGATRCVDFQSDLEAPGFSKADAEQVFRGGLMEWWKNYKGTKAGSLITLLLGANLLGIIFIVFILMG